jgi:PIN domain nuclease of toxin-antitoxin system
VKLLLDIPKVVLCAAEPSDKLSKNAAALIDAKENELFLSSANTWGVAIERTLVHEDIKHDPRVSLRLLLDNCYSGLSIARGHVYIERKMIVRFASNLRWRSGLERSILIAVRCDWTS